GPGCRPARTERRARAAERSRRAAEPHRGAALLRRPLNRGDCRGDAPLSRQHQARMADGARVALSRDERARRRMTHEPWQPGQERLHQALELPESARGPYLDSACPAELRAEIDSLLDSHRDAGTFIEPGPPAPAAPDSLGPGAGIGPYRIVQLIQEGGMGAVYQAVRVDDLYRKVVAIKGMRRGMEGEYALRHFDTERQMLAHLDRPSIAKLLDGGTTPDGRPYFVMDFIAGTPIDEYCDAHKLTVRERLDVFLTVCSAVHYAHQNLVIHRDLKPPNIL